MCPRCNGVNVIAQDNWHIAGLGETLEKNWLCKDCKLDYREVYLYSCEINNETEEML
jgi:hypothetical protein